MSFLCGVFVPSEFMSESIVSFSHFLPLYWFVDATKYIASHNFNEIFSPHFFVCLLIQLAYAIIFFVAGIIIQKRRNNMLIDVIIRVLTAIELLFLININGITTASVVMSICVLIILEFSLLISNNILSTCLLFTPFFICLIYLMINSNSYTVFAIISLFYFCCFYYYFHNSM